MDKWLKRLDPKNLPSSSKINETPTTANIEKSNKTKSSKGDSESDIDRIKLVQDKTSDDNPTEENETTEHQTIELEGLLDKSNPRKKAKTTAKKKCESHKFHNKFSESWTQMSSFKHWLEKSTKVIKGNEYAHCKVCNIDILAHKTDIKRHSLSARHKTNQEKIVTNKKITDLEINPVTSNVRRAELKLCGLLATNNLPFSLMDTLTPLCSNLLPDSKIARNLTSKRIKANMIKHALGDNFKEDLFLQLRRPGTDILFHHNR